MKSGIVGRRRGLAVLLVVAGLGLAACDPGWVMPIAGTGDGSGTPGAAVPEAQAAFTAPGSVAVSPVTNDVYVADTVDCTISKIHDGQVSVVAGTPGSCGDTGDGGPATAAEIQPDKLQVAPDGSVYFVQDSTEIRHISGDGVIHTVPYTRPADVASKGIVGYSVDETSSVRIIESPLVLSDPGHLYVERVDADGTQTLERSQSISGTVFSAVPIDPENFYVTQAMIAGYGPKYLIARLDTTSGAMPMVVYTGLKRTLFAASPDGTLYASYPGNHISRIDPDGTITTIAGNGTADPATTRYLGPGSDQPLTVTGAAVTRNDGLVFTSGHVVYRMASPDLAGATTTTVASS